MVWRRGVVGLWRCAGERRGGELRRARGLMGWAGRWEKKL